MAITVSCPSCAKSYQVKDDAAGKKFRCKACQSIVPVPESAAAAEGDPWDKLELGEDQDPYGDVDSAPVQAPARRRKKKTARASRRGGGMPASIIVAVSCTGILVLFNLVGVVSQLMQQVVPGACGSFVRMLIEIGIIVGLLQGNSVSRWISIVLGAVGIVSFLSCIGFFVFAGQADLFQGVDMSALDLPLLIGILAVQIAMQGTVVASLLMPSAAEYCSA